MFFWVVLIGAVLAVFSYCSAWRGLGCVRGVMAVFGYAFVPLLV